MTSMWTTARVTGRGRSSTELWAPWHTLCNVPQDAMKLGRDYELTSESWQGGREQCAGQLPAWSAAHAGQLQKFWQLILVCTRESLIGRAALASSCSRSTEKI